MQNYCNKAIASLGGIDLPDGKKNTLVAFAEEVMKRTK
jgi:hypothetical protein